MPIKGDTFLNKLILLFVFDKMEIPMSSDTIEEICWQQNDWISFMDCKTTLSNLLDAKFIYEIPPTNNTKAFYSITPKGRVCLADFYTNIPKSLRENIANYVRLNRLNYRRKQEYIADYYRNADGTYTVHLKILTLSCLQLDLKIQVPTRQIAKNIYTQWPQKAEDLYSSIYDILVNNEF